MSNTTSTFSVNDIVLPRRSTEALLRGEPWIEWQELATFRILAQKPGKDNWLVANVDTGEQDWVSGDRLTPAPAGWMG